MPSRESKASRYVRRHEEYTSFARVTLKYGTVLDIPLNRGESRLGWYWRQICVAIADHLHL